MRYGKVYYYDRMGNREPTESERIRDALENFDAPRFRPPGEPNVMKTYTFSPLETPPPMSGSPVVASHLLETSHFNQAASVVPDDDMTMPLHLIGDDTKLHDPEKFAMNLPKEVYPDDPMPLPRILTPPAHRVDFNLGVDIEKDLDVGVARGVDRSYEDSIHDATRELGNIRFEARDTSHLSHDESYGDEVCAQCRLEDMHMDRMRKEAMEEKQKHDELLRKAEIYDSDMKRKEESYKVEENARNKALREHIDQVNAELIEANRRRPKSPLMEYGIFRREDDSDKMKSIQAKKDEYRAQLDKQVEDKRLRLIEEFERNEALDATSNARAAYEFAAARDSEKRANEHAKEMARKQLEFQMEMERLAPKKDDKWLWWAERPDEHGWRDARLANQKHTNQVERNQSVKLANHMLEEFKRRQAEDDAEASRLRREKYDRIREQLHENAKMIHPGMKKTESRPVIPQLDPRVEAAWREAHERNDKRFRRLQENPMRSISGAAVDGAFAQSAHSSSCKRCIRCARPLQRSSTFTVQRGETVFPPLNRLF